MPTLSEEDLFIAALPSTVLFTTSRVFKKKCLAICCQLYLLNISNSHTISASFLCLRRILWVPEVPHTFFTLVCKSCKAFFRFLNSSLTDYASAFPAPNLPLQWKSITYRPRRITTGKVSHFHFAKCLITCCQANQITRDSLDSSAEHKCYPTFPLQS